MKAYSMSTNRLTKLNDTAISKTPPIATGQSLLKKADTICAPRPGMAKIVSVSTAPPSRKPKDKPAVVVTGIIAFLRA